MAIRYTLIGLDETVERRLSGHSLAVAQTLEGEEVGTELLSQRTIEALIRLVTKAPGFGKHVNVYIILQELLKSGFLKTVETR